MSCIIAGMVITTFEVDALFRRRLKSQKHEVLGAFLRTELVGTGMRIHEHGIIARFVAHFALHVTACSRSVGAPSMIGAATIFSDPSFRDWRSRFFWLVFSTLLTVLVIPAIYISLRSDDKDFDAKNETI